MEGGVSAIDTPGWLPIHSSDRAPDCHSLTHGLHDGRNKSQRREDTEVFWAQICRGMHSQ